MVKKYTQEENKNATLITLKRGRKLKYTKHREGNGQFTQKLGLLS